MTRKKTIASMLAAIAALTGASIPSATFAQTGGGEAQNIRKLGIMLMVTSLRCRTGEHDFRAEYQRFSAAHIDNLNQAAGDLRGQMQARYGTRGSKRAFDRIDVQIANTYGDGHPWLDCEQLKYVTHDLSLSSDRIRLSAAARELLTSPAAFASEGPQPQLAVEPSLLATE